VRKTFACLQYKIGSFMCLKIEVASIYQSKLILMNEVSRKKFELSVLYIYIYIYIYINIASRWTTGWETVLQRPVTSKVFKMLFFP
jgi:hypothetical protein